MPPSGLWLITDAHWLKFHPSVSSPSVPYIVLPALLRNLQQWSPATILQIHFCAQQACTAAKHCPNHTSWESDFSRASEDCFLCVSIWKRPQLLPFHKRRLVRSEGRKKLDVPASAGRRNTVYWEWNTRISSSSEHNPGSYFSVDTGENNSAWPYRANMFTVQMAALFFPPASMYYQSWSIPPVAQWVLHMCLCPLCPMPPLAGTHAGKLSFSHFSMSQLLSRKTASSQHEAVCYQMHTSQKMQDGTSCTWPHLTSYPVQQFWKQCVAVACWKSRGCTF